MVTTLGSNGQRTKFAELPKPRSDLGRGHRRVSWMLLGVVLVVGCSLAFAVIAVRSTGGQEVLVMARSVDMGQIIEADDLRTADVSANGLGLVAASEQSSVVGRTAAVPLVEGAILSPESVGATSGLADGEAVVAVSLSDGRYPPSLTSGDNVRVVATPDAPVEQGAATRPESVDAVVAGVEFPVTAGNSSAVVTLRVPDARADGLAALGAAGDVSLVLTPAGGS